MFVGVVNKSKFISTFLFNFDNKMSSSGVLVNTDVQSTFQRMAEGKKDFRYIIFKIEDKEVVVETAVSQDDLGLEGTCVHVYFKPKRWSY